MNKDFHIEFKFTLATGRNLAKYANLCGFPTLTLAVEHLIAEGIKAKEAEDVRTFDAAKGLDMRGM